MSTSTLIWADTAAEPPAAHPHATACWLVGRHPQLAGLLERLPGVVEVHGGRPGLDLELIGDSLAALDVHQQAWSAYRQRTYEPRADDAWQAWSDAGPVLPDGPVGPVVDALTLMSDSELLRVRLLGAWAPTGTRLPLTSTSHLDVSGRRLLADWIAAVLAY